jgi:hypothetical protein
MNTVQMNFMKTAYYPLWTRILRFFRSFSLALYTFAGVRITSDTGLAPWDGGFWVILIPLFLLGEWTLREASRWLQPAQ